MNNARTARDDNTYNDEWYVQEYVATMDKRAIRSMMNGPVCLHKLKMKLPYYHLSVWNDPSTKIHNKTYKKLYTIQIIYNTPGR